MKTALTTAALAIALILLLAAAFIGAHHYAYQGVPL